jgi:hypothetical protein
LVLRVEEVQTDEHLQMQM